jgi:hypothetical protein
MKYTLLILMLLISGCSVFKTETSMTEPVLLKQAPLPQLPRSLADTDVNLLCELLIGKDGIVKRAKLLKSSGDATWDYLAEDSFMKWVFSPALLDGEPAEILIRRKVKFLYLEPEIIMLGEICCRNIDEAEKVYKELQSGENFSKLARQYSISPTKEQDGIVGKVDIRYYTKNIRGTLAVLKEDEYTKPVQYGDHYVIFKRLAVSKENVQLDY